MTFRTLEERGKRITVNFNQIFVLRHRFNVRRPSSQQWLRNSKVNRVSIQILKFYTSFIKLSLEGFSSGTSFYSLALQYFDQRFYKL